MNEQNGILSKVRLFFLNSKRRLLLFLLVLGPSTITTMAGNDGAGVITYSLAGAKFGYTILFILPALTLLYAITQEMGSRIAIVTRKGLGDLIREQFGIKTAILVFSLLLIANFGSILTNVSALKISSELLNIHPFPFIFIVDILAFLLVSQTSYRISQKIFLGGVILYLSYVFSAFKAGPDWTQSINSFIIPSTSMLSKEFIFTSIAVLGTTITPWGQFFVQSYMKDKNLPIETLRFAKLEAYFGSTLSNFFTYFIIVATASTLFINKIPLTSGAQAALAIKPFAGEFASFLFSVGLLAAAIIGMIIISLSSAYVFSEFFGFEGTLDAPYNRSKTFYTILLINLILASILVSFPFISLFGIVLYTQSLNGVLLPLILYFILRIVNDKEIMGNYTNSKFYNYVAGGGAILIAVFAFAAVMISLLGY